MEDNNQIIPLQIYKKEMKEMQREVNYLRKRVTDLNYELDKPILEYDEAIRQVSTGSGKDGQSKWKEQTPVRVEDFVKAIKDLTNLTGAV